jgi:Na+/melibiose symporter-like transporter
MPDASLPRYVRAERTEPLSFRIKFYQGIGSLPDTIKNWVFNTFALLYYNQILGLDAFWVSVALGAAVVFDAFADPLAATYSDNLVTRWGRRHPLMLISALPLGASLTAVFMPPSGLSHMGLFFWLLGFTLLCRGLMTVYFVPWAAIAAELSDDYHERTSVMSHRYAIGWAIGIGLPFFVYTKIMHGTLQHPVGQLNPDAYAPMAILAGCLISGGALATTLLTWNQIPYMRQHASAPEKFSAMQTFRELVRSLDNKQFRLVFMIVLISSAIVGTTTNIGIYMTTYFWGLTSEDLRWYMPASALGVLIALPLVAGVQRRWDKKHILMTTSIAALVEGVGIVNLRFFGLLPKNHDPRLLWVLLGTWVVAVAITVVQGVIGSSIVADLLDDQELRTGYRQEGMFNAALSFSTKAVSGLGTVLGGLIITAIQFPIHAVPDEVPPAMLTRLGLIVGMLVPMFHVFPIAMIARYTLTREKYAEIRAALDARR